MNSDPHVRLVERCLAAIVAICIVAMLLVVTGCASGVVMTDEEQVACRTQGCSAFTSNEIRALIGKVFNDAFRLGWIDATKQRGAGI